MAENTSKRVAAVYAEALFEAAGGGDAAGPVRDDVNSLRQTLEHFPALGHLLGNPQIPAQQHEQMIRSMFEGKVHTLTLNFLLVLKQRWRLGSLGPILDEYARLDNTQRLGRREVRITSAVPLDEALRSKIRQAITTWGGFEPVLHERHDPSLLGGLVIQVGDRKIDASVLGQLEQMREKMKNEFLAKVSAV